MNERKTDWILIEHLQTRFEVRRNRERTNLYGGIGYILHPCVDEANLIFCLKKRRKYTLVQNFQRFFELWRIFANFLIADSKKWQTMRRKLNKKEIWNERQSSFFRIKSSWRDFIQTQPQCPAFRLLLIERGFLSEQAETWKFSECSLKNFTSALAKKRNCRNTTSMEHFNTRNSVRRIVL